MAHMFTADGALIIRLPGSAVHEARGHEALDKLFKGAIASPALSMPAVHNIAIQVMGDEAIATSWIELHVSNDQHPDGHVFAGSGTYDDPPASRGRPLEIRAARGRCAHRRRHPARQAHRRRLTRTAERFQPACIST